MAHTHYNGMLDGEVGTDYSGRQMMTYTIQKNYDMRCLTYGVSGAVCCVQLSKYDSAVSMCARSVQPLSASPLFLASASPSMSPSPMCVSISPYEYAYLSSVVYGDKEISGLTGWSSLPPTSAAILTGFYGQLFNRNGTFVLAIRGSVGFRDYLADISLATTGEYLSDYIDQAINYLDTSLRNQNTKCLTFTGHSLGAALAEVLAGKYESSSIGFENPGAANYMKIQNIPNGDVTAYQASPNLINTLDTSAISTIYRVYPEYSYPSAAISCGRLWRKFLNVSAEGCQLIDMYVAYTLQQHSMIDILLQFNSVTGEPYVVSKQTDAWRLFSHDSGYTGFFKRYDLNSYYWLNLDNTLLRSVLDTVSTSLNTDYNFFITGSDNHDDLLWGAGDYDDILEGKSGNDEYWAFNGVNNIRDESGNDVYHFFTTNMQGITTINDGDALGSITLDNYGNCNIQSLGIVLANIVGSGNVVSAFYPNDPNTGCQPDSTFSSQAYGILNNYHNNDIFFLQLSGKNLMISLNSIATNPSKHGTIVITNFQDGNLDISLNVADRRISNPKIYYVSVTPGEVLKCDINQDSYLFGLVGSNIYMNYENNPYNCVMVGNSDSANTFIFTSGYVKSKNVKIHPSVATGTSTIQGYKSGDLIDVSALNSISASFQQDVGVGQVTMTCSNGVTILLPSVYNNISYTLDGKNNLTFVPAIVSPFNTTTITTTLTASQTPTPTNSDTNTDNVIPIFHIPNQTSIIDLTKLFGRTNISDIVIRFPKNFTNSGMKLLPMKLGNHTYGQPLAPYVLASSSQSFVDLGNSSTGLEYNSTYKQFWAAAGRIKWYFSSPGAYFTDSVTLGVNGSIYAAGDQLYCLNLDGTLRWSYNYSLWSGTFYSFRSPILRPDGGGIYMGGFGSEAYLFSLSLNGLLQWNSRLDNSYVYSSPAIGADGSIYISTYNIYSLSANGTLKWSYEQTIGWGSSPAIATDGSSVYIGAGNLYCFDTNGTLKWIYSLNNTRNSIHSPVIGKNGNIYITSDNYLHCINSSGSLQWSFAVAGRVSTVDNPVVLGIDDSVYVGSESNYADSGGGKFYCINSNGSLKWSYDSGWIWSSAAIGVDGSIYVISTSLFSFNPNGTLQWSFPINDYLYEPTIGVDGSIYIAPTYSQTIISLSIKIFGQSPWPMSKQNLQRSGRIPDNINYTHYDLRYWILTGYSALKSEPWCLEVEDVSGIPADQKGIVKIVCINQVNSNTDTQTNTPSRTASSTITSTFTNTGTTKVTDSNTKTLTTTISVTETKRHTEALAVSSYNSLTYPSSSPSAVASSPSLSMASIASSSASPSPVVSSVKDYTSSACINQPLLIGFIKTTRTKTEYLLNYAKNIIDVWMNDDNFIRDNELLADKNNALLKNRLPAHKGVSTIKLRN